MRNLLKFKLSNVLVENKKKHNDDKVQVKKSLYL